MSFGKGLNWTRLKICRQVECVVWVRLNLDKAKNLSSGRVCRLGKGQFGQG